MIRNHRAHAQWHRMGIEIVCAFHAACLRHLAVPCIHYCFALVHDIERFANSDKLSTLGYFLFHLVLKSVSMSVYVVMRNLSVTQAYIGEQLTCIHTTLRHQQPTNDRYKAERTRDT